MLTKARSAEDVVEIGEDQEVTDMQNFLSILATGTGESAKLSGFVKVAAASVASSILFLAPTNALSTDHIERTPAIANQQAEGYIMDESTAHKLASIRERYEKTLFSYPGLVIYVQRNASGDPISATILVPERKVFKTMFFKVNLVIFHNRRFFRLVHFMGAIFMGLWYYNIVFIGYNAYCTELFLTV